VASSFEEMKRDVRIRGETIRLGQLLKLEGLIESGADVKAFLSTVPVWVNGEREARRGRKLHVDDIVQVEELELRLTSEDLDIRRSASCSTTTSRASRTVADLRRRDLERSPC
jgi:ribosome-associated protein